MKKNNTFNDDELFDIELFDIMYNVALEHMNDNFRNIEVFLKLKSMFGEEKAIWFIDTWEKI